MLTSQLENIYECSVGSDQETKKILLCDTVPGSG